MLRWSYKLLILIPTLLMYVMSSDGSGYARPAKKPGLTLILEGPARPEKLGKLGCPNFDFQGPV